MCPISLYEPRLPPLSREGRFDGDELTGADIAMPPSFYYRRPLRVAAEPAALQGLQYRVLIFGKVGKRCDSLSETSEHGRKSPRAWRTRDKRNFVASMS